MALDDDDEIIIGGGRRSSAPTGDEAVVTVTYRNEVAKFDVSRPMTWRQKLAILRKVWSLL